MYLDQSELHSASKHLSILSVLEGSENGSINNIESINSGSTTSSSSNDSQGSRSSSRNSCKKSTSDASTITCNQSIIHTLADDASYNREVLQLPALASPTECTAALLRNINSLPSSSPSLPPSLSEPSQLDGTDTLSPPGQSIGLVSPVSDPDVASVTTASTLHAESPVPPLTPDNSSICDDYADEQQNRALRLALELKVIRSLKPEQEAVRVRFALHQAKQTDALRNDQDSRREGLKETHQSSLEELEEQVCFSTDRSVLGCNITKADHPVLQHADKLNVMEERQLEEELHAEERQRHDHMHCMLRLRHLREACFGLTSANGRTITSQDLAELEGQKRAYEKIGQRQEDEIRILRAQQDRRFQARVAKYEMELKNLHAAYEHNQAEMRKDFDVEVEELRALYERRMQKLEMAWR